MFIYLVDYVQLSFLCGTCNKGVWVKIKSQKLHSLCFTCRNLPFTSSFFLGSCMTLSLQRKEKNLHRQKLVWINNCVDFNTFLDARIG